MSSSTLTMHRCVILICVIFYISDEFSEQVEAKHRDVFVPYTNSNGKWIVSNEDSIPDSKIPVLNRNTIYEPPKAKVSDVRVKQKSQRKSKRKGKHHKRKPMMKRIFTKTNETESVSEERKSMPVDIVVHIKMNE